MNLSALRKSYPVQGALCMVIALCLISSAQVEAIRLQNSVPLRVLDPSHRQTAFQLLENDLDYKLVAMVPGVAAENVSVNITDDAMLKIVANDTSGREVFQRTVRLGSDANTTDVLSWCVDGILEVTVRKLEKPEPVSVQVQSQEPVVTNSENKKHFNKVWSIPGVRPEEVSVTIETDLKLGRQYLRYNATSKRGYGQYLNSVVLPEGAVTDRAEAFCAHGLLHVQVPEADPVVPVPVPVSDTDGTELDNETSIQLSHISLPGYTAKDVTLEAKPGYIFLKITAKTGNIIQRYLALPEDLHDLHALKARCVDGVLTVEYDMSGLVQRQDTEIPVLNTRPTYAEQGAPAGPGQMNRVIIRDGGFRYDRLLASRAFEEFFSLL
mmetsp:Transcript_10914/g.12839  ORF Transcript_10914/g.12839 Transcript_10914/m.12839 type:complete len:381 (-) Transcript_10914:249-1391(-)|eukprot:CAMPEP_0197843462 /NCGR_PEP_ID=MMETSP1438-20131217/344_1 /TAXON_ID=1461541 /ORGANISM="Pterosperma sp., Strain CCMP1384" /LENGTH=380 /DNA_ID=CAMNT_0043453629 /DNA_START=99 /DNA_END=1241 /DNA_ORIENTATION=+